jgi:hypothetical protein
MHRTNLVLLAPYCPWHHPAPSAAISLKETREYKHTLKQRERGQLVSQQRNFAPVFLACLSDTFMTKRHTIPSGVQDCVPIEDNANTKPVTL